MEPITSTPELRCQVLVYGGTVAGIAAALASAQSGCRTVLIERGEHFGGMTASGLGSIDTLRDNAFGGLFREFLSRVRQFYREKYGPNSEQYRLTYGGFMMEPHVAEATLLAMLRDQPNLHILTRHELTGAVREGNRLISSSYRARDTGESVVAQHDVAVDGTYEGDLAAAAGVAFRVGREGRQQFDERFAGVMFYDWRPHRKVMLPESTGEPSEHIQANCFRVTLSDDASCRIPFSRPDSYADFYPRFRELLTDIDTGRLRFLRETLWLTPQANRKYCVNGHIEALTSLDLAEYSAEWAVADWTRRDSLYELYKGYTQGMFYFLQNDPAVPRILREDACSFGLAPDEYPGNGNFPWQLYVRQARRIVGEYTLTEHDSIPTGGRARPHIHPDSIAICEHSFDCHACRDRHHPGATRTTPDGFELMEGVLWFRSRNPETIPNRPATIPYRSMVPEHVDGLLVPGAVSSSHVAFSALRMEPAWMALGEASGLAAAQAIEQGRQPRSIDVRQLQRTLVRRRHVLVYFRDLSLDDPAFEQIQMTAIENDYPHYEASGVRR